MIQARDIQVAILDGLLGGGHGQLGVAVVAPRLLGIHVKCRVEILHFGTYLASELGGIETGYASDSALAGQKA